MNYKYSICIVILALAWCTIGAKTQKGKLPDGFYDIEFFGNSDCAGSPSRFTYKQLNVCRFDLDRPEYYEMTTCTDKDYETLTYCPKGCDQCGGTSSGPIGCLRVSGVYSILRTCGPAPKLLYGYTWLLEYKSASGDCSGSALKSGTVTNSCYPTSFNSGVKYECTSTTRTETRFDKCDLFTCNNCQSESKDVENDIGQCRDSKTFECVTV